MKTIERFITSPFRELFNPERIARNSVVNLIADVAVSDIDHDPAVGVKRNSLHMKNGEVLHFEKEDYKRQLKDYLGSITSNHLEFMQAAESVLKFTAQVRSQISPDFYLGNMTDAQRNLIGFVVDSSFKGLQIIPGDLKVIERYDKTNPPEGYRLIGFIEKREYYQEPDESVDARMYYSGQPYKVYAGYVTKLDKVYGKLGY